MYRFTHYIIINLRPRFCSLIIRIIYYCNRISFGNRFKSDSIPRIIVDPNCFLRIGNNVDFKRNVEIRAHGNSRIIIEENVKIDRGVRILAANNSTIHIGKNTRIGLYSVLNGGDSITIGEKSLISGFVYIQTSNHGYSNKEMAVQEQGYIHAPIVIKKDSWLAAHVVIMPGITLSEGTIVGSNAVVTKSTKPYQIIAGIPAKPIKEREQ